MTSRGRMIVTFRTGKTLNEIVKLIEIGEIMNVIEKKINDITFRLKEEHDFSWINKYGNVFEVFYHQTSGNICFGVDKNEEKLFLKYAGASTINFEGCTTDTIDYLKKSTRIYEEIQHPNLVKMIDHFEVGDGYLVIFKWSEGESLHTHMKYTKEEKYTNPHSPNYRFNKLTQLQKIEAINTIIDLHVLLSENGYIAVDFYDGSMMYDFRNNSLMICDIDLYEKGPFINSMGRMFGSSRLMAPEEFQKGAVIDGITNVFLLGAMAFEILGNSRNKTKEEWSSFDELYIVASKAVDENRLIRYQSVKQFQKAWQNALSELDISKEFCNNI